MVAAAPEAVEAETSARTSEFRQVDRAESPHISQASSSPLRARHRIDSIDAHAQVESFLPFSAITLPTMSVRHPRDDRQARVLQPLGRDAPIRASPVPQRHTARGAIVCRRVPSDIASTSHGPTRGTSGASRTVVIGPRRGRRRVVRIRLADTRVVVSAHHDHARRISSRQPREHVHHVHRDALRMPRIDDHRRVVLHAQAAAAISGCTRAVRGGRDTRRAASPMPCESEKLCRSSCFAYQTKQAPSRSAECASGRNVGERSGECRVAREANRDGRRFRRRRLRCGR